MAEVGTYYVTIMPDVSKFSDKIVAELNGAAQQTSDAGEKAGSGFAQRFGTAASVFLGNVMTQVANTAVNAFVNGISGGIERLDTMAVFPKIMANMGIEAEDSQRAIQRVSNAIIGLPTALDDAARSVQRLTMSTGDIDRATDVFIAFNNALISGGAPTQLQASALEQFTQAVNKGKPDMLEWRTLMNAMPAQLSQIAASMGMTSAELGEGLRHGDIAMDDFLDAIVRLNTDGVGQFASFSEQVQEMTGTVQVALANARNRIEKFWQAIFEGVGQERIADFINGLTIKLPEVGQAIGGVLSDIVTFFDETNAQFEELGLNDLLDDMQANLDELGRAFSLEGENFLNINEWARAVGVVFNNFVLVPLNDALVLANALVDAFNTLRLYLFGSSNPAESIYYTDISGMGAAGTPTASNWESETNFFRDTTVMFENLENTGVKAAENVSTAWGEAGVEMEESTTTATENMSQAWDDFSGGIRFGWQQDASVFGMSMGHITMASTKAEQSIKTSFGNIKVSGSEAFDAIYRNISTDMSKSTSVVDTEVGKMQSKLNSLQSKRINVELNVFKTGISKIGVDGTLAGGGFSVWTAAAGGIATSPTFGVFGEAGDEALIPLSNRDKVRPFARAVAAEMGGGTVNNYYIDGNLVAADATLAAALGVVAERVGGRRRMGVA